MVSCWLNWLCNCVDEDDLDLLYFMCIHVFPECVYVYRVCAVPTEARRGCHRAAFGVRNWTQSSVRAVHGFYPSPYVLFYVQALWALWEECGCCIYGLFLSAFSALFNNWHIKLYIFKMYTVMTWPLYALGINTSCISQLPLLYFFLIFGNNAYYKLSFKKTKHKIPCYW